jgi:hypothetical protein
MDQIFAHHATAAYVAKVRSVRVLGEGVALLRAVAGMVPPGGSAINPAVILCPTAHLRTEQRQCLKDLRSLHPQLATAYELLQRFRRLLQEH